MVDTMNERLIELREKIIFHNPRWQKEWGVTPALISAYEKNERKPSIDKLSALADIYNTSTDYILGRTANSNHDKCLIDATGLSPNQIKVIRNLISVMTEDNTTK